MSVKARDEAYFDRVVQLLPGFDPTINKGDCHFDYDAARVAVEFFPDMLQHVKGLPPGTPLNLEEWQEAIVANLFGWLRPDGTRRFRECMVYVPRKNGKTTLLAGLVILMLCCDGEPGAEVYSAAGEFKQAQLVFDQAAQMVLREPMLKGRCRIFKGFKQIAIEDEGSFYKAISAEADSKHGFNAHFCVVDELHTQPNRNLVDVLSTSMGSRSQPLMVYITTADFARPSICNEKKDYALGVCDYDGKGRGINDQAFLPALWRAESDADWRDPAVWRAANPNFGISVSEEYIARECQKAQEVPGYENTFKRLHLNISTATDTRAISLESYDALGDIDREAGRDGRKVYASVDMSNSADLTGCALAWIADDGVPEIDIVGWLPEEQAEKRARRDKVDYPVWLRDGYLRGIEGPEIRYDVVERDIGELGDQYNICEIAADPWNAKQLIQNLNDSGFEAYKFSQNMASFCSPTKDLLSRISTGKIRFSKNPALRWCMQNMSLIEDASGNKRPCKKKSTERIDLAVAAIMALDRVTADQAAPPVDIFVG